MTQKEIKAKADEAVEMFRKIPALKDFDGMDLTCANQCAIIMYTEVVKIAESVDLYFKIDDYKAILSELKSRI